MNKNIKKIVCTLAFSTVLLSTTAFAATLTKQEAKAIALAKTNGGVVTKLKREYDDGKLVYDVIVKKGNVKYSMDIGVNDSKIYDFEQVTYGSTANTNKNTTSTTTTITQEKAKEIALLKAGGKGTVTKLKLDREDGIMVWEVEIKDGRWEYEMEINAQTGSIIKFEKDYDD